MTTSGSLERLFCLHVPPAEIWLDWLKDEIRLTEEEPNREKVYELFERAVKDYICECSATLAWSGVLQLPYSVFLLVFSPLESRSRYLAWIHAVLDWWDGFSRRHRESEIHLWESCDGGGPPHDQGADCVGSVQGVWKRHSVYAAGWNCFLFTHKTLDDFLSNVNRLWCALFVTKENSLN